MLVNLPRHQYGVEAEEAGLVNDIGKHLRLQTEASVSFVRGTIFPWQGCGCRN